MASERQISVGGVKIGGGAPVVVQSMTLTKTHDVEATTAQIAALASAGCELARVAVPKNEDAAALPKLVRLSPIPVIADIHFNASLALKAIDAGVAAVRINPGNIGGPDKVAEVVRAAKAKGTPMRIGANAGSLPDHLQELARQDTAEALVVEALEQVELLERLDFRDFKISVKASHVPTMIRAYRMLSAKVPYPLHLGVTEAGTPFAGSIKSAVGMGALLMDGIGDTLRVSLTADPVKEVEVAWEILKALGLRERGPVMIACPSCGRDNVGVENLARVVEERLVTYPQAFEVAVMGCAVNGPGEAGDADFGIAGGRDVGFVYAHGRVLKKVSSDILDRRALLRDRPLDRAGDARPETPEDGEARRARDGRGFADPARLVSAPTRGQPAPHSSSCRRCATTPRDAEAVSHRLLVRGGFIRQVSAGLWTFLPLGLARPPQGRADHPRGDGRDRRPGDADAGADAGRALGGDRPRPRSRRSSTSRTASGRRFILPLTHEETFTLPRARDPVVQAAAAALVPLPDQGSRRAAAARRACSACASSS